MFLCTSLLIAAGWTISCFPIPGYAGCEVSNEYTAEIATFCTSTLPDVLARMQVVPVLRGKTAK